MQFPKPGLVNVTCSVLGTPRNLFILWEDGEAADFSLETPALGREQSNYVSCGWQWMPRM